jgi:predicted nuclease of restriction endonuclease-like RecB superfamily
VIPWSLLDYANRAGELVPHFLGEGDTIWLRALLDAHERFVGRRRRDLDEYLQAPLPVACPPRSLRRARHVLDRLWDSETVGGVAPRDLREAVFTAVATGLSRDLAIGRVGRRLGLSPREVEAALFADLPGERRLAQRPSGLNPWELALRVNLAMAQSVLRCARRVQVDLEGHARTLVGQAKWGGLMCVAKPGRGSAQITLEISGPMALFRRALVYGRALAALVPQLVWCDRYCLRADCEIDGEPRRFVLQSGDPIFPAAEPRRFDSKVEARFYDDFRRAAPDWDLIREPEPLAVGSTLIFPDFAIQHRRHRWRRWLLEIAGFWTPDYVQRKLGLLGQVGRRDLILCVDADRQCDGEEAVGRGRVVPYKRRVDPAGVLRIIERPGPIR